MHLEVSERSRMLQLSIHQALAIADINHIFLQVLTESGSC
jgi:hypothetical protein